MRMAFFKVIIPTTVLSDCSMASAKSRLQIVSDQIEFLCDNFSFLYHLEPVDAVIVVTLCVFVCACVHVYVCITTD